MRKYFDQVVEEETDPLPQCQILEVPVRDPERTGSGVSVIT